MDMGESYSFSVTHGTLLQKNTLLQSHKNYINKQINSSKRASNERPYITKDLPEIERSFYHGISMGINEDFSFYRLYHGIYAPTCSRRTPVKAYLLKLYFLLRFSKVLSNRQYRRFSFRANQDTFCHNTTPCL